MVHERRTKRARIAAVPIDITQHIAAEKRNRKWYKEQRVSWTSESFLRRALFPDSPTCRKGSLRGHSSRLLRRCNSRGKSCTSSEETNDDPLVSRDLSSCEGFHSRDLPHEPSTAPSSSQPHRFVLLRVGVDRLTSERLGGLRDRRETY